MATNHIPVPAAQAALSLLSLSASLSSTPPASHPHSSSTAAPPLGRFAHTPRSSVSIVKPPAASPGSHPGPGKRRPSSAAQTRRRTSDAASAAASVVARAGAPPSTGDPTVPSMGPVTDSAEPAPSGGKVKKGTIVKCETCSKVYRHPNCLVKHRWEHSPHWREASKFLLSKHQQVQMLEAAAILSHISPAKNGVGTSLPEDRSLWPAYLSGGLLPMPGASAPMTSPAAPLSAPVVAPVNASTYREREMSVSTSAIDDEDNTAISGESSDEDEDLEREDSGYGSSSAAPVQSTSAVAVPGHRQPQMYMAMSVGGHEYTLSSSHAACDAGAHMGSLAFQQSMFAASRSISSSSFGVSSLRGGREDEADDEGETNDDNTNTHGRPKWDEDESMAMDMDL